MGATPRGKRGAGPTRPKRLPRPTIPSLEHLRTPVWVYDVLGYRVLWANRAGLELWEASDIEELRARDFRIETSRAVESALRHFLAELQTGRSVREWWWQISPRGHQKRVLCLCSAFVLEDGRTAMLMEGVQDGSSEAGQLTGSALMISDYDEEGRLLSANPPFRECFEVEGHDFTDLFAHPGDAAVLLAEARENDGQARRDARMLTRNGPRWHSVELRIGRGEGGPPALLLQMDMHERKAREMQLAQQAVTDSLTGLANRTGMTRRLEQMRARSRPFTLFYVDLDGFKLINDTFGHAVGDTLLEQVAERLETLAGNGALVARIGGDEFVIAAEPDSLQASPEAFATWIVSSVSRPYRAAGVGSLTLSASVGIAHFPQHGQDIDELLANGDTAMYAAKSRGRRRWISYAPGMRDRFRRRTLVAQELPGAGSRGELSLAYQPVVLAPGNEVVAVEALLRWSNPQLGSIPPLEAVAAAEETGLVAELEEWVLRRAAGDLARLRRVFGSHLVVNVNVSSRHLGQPDFVPRLEASLADLRLLPTDLVLELTEGSMVPDGSESGANAVTLGNRGYRIAIDDFGTGYSCLAYLHRLPAAYVKIDRAFVARLDEDSATVPGIQALARGFDMQTVGEGVETRAQAECLAEHGVMLQQGYLFGHAQPLRELVAGARAATQPRGAS